MNAFLVLLGLFLGVYASPLTKVRFNSKTTASEVMYQLGRGLSGTTAVVTGKEHLSLR
jgi:hypothetical protein